MTAPLSDEDRAALLAATGMRSFTEWGEEFYGRIYRAGAAREREACLAACKKIEDAACAWIKTHPDDIGDGWKQAQGVSDGAYECVAAIRARGE